MKTNAKILGMARKLWPGAHQRYQQMCSLAATGQLGGPQMFELNEHLPGCGSCREFLESVAQASLQTMPVLAGNRALAEDTVPPEGMRARFLSRLVAEKSRKEANVPFVLVPSADKQHSVAGLDTRSSPRKLPIAIGTRRTLWLAGFKWAGAAVVVGLVVSTIAFYLGERRAISKAAPQLLGLQRPVQPPVQSIVGIAPTEVAADRVALFQRQKTELASERAQLQRKLSDARAERESLKAELARTQARLVAKSTQAQTDARPSDAESEAAKQQVQALLAQVTRLDQRLADSEVKLDVQKQVTEEMTAKLEMTEADLRRERDLKSAKTELGDLIAARNLHIVDVYDADGKGKRQQAFGRVFYIEGKSLVFYAYDLEDPRRLNANVVFHVWGERAGMKTATHSLGLLHNEDVGQGRWAMSFDDSKVLAQINSVFVTVEARNKHYDEPRGKRVLYAYFGNQPNHP